MPFDSSAPHRTQSWVSDLPPPPSKEVVLSVRAITEGQRLSPKQILFTYEDEAWEEFVREWACVLTPKYHSVGRFGGSGDHGIDVAGFVSEAGLDGIWDCFQCKHYIDPLRPSDLWPEIFKILLAVSNEEFTMPRRYVLLAPRGCGSTLERLLAAPSKLRAKFLQELGKSDGFAKQAKEEDRVTVIALAEKTDFSMFQSADIDEIIALHATTPHHILRFGGSLPDGTVAKTPPSSIEPDENRYVAQLVDVYREKHNDSTLDVAAVQTDRRTEDHFRRQRESFYSAESLRMFARDSVPQGTFESLQDEVLDGVVELAASDHPDGMARLTGVLLQATNLNMTSNALITVTQTIDRKGICHQLANVDRLLWCKGVASDPLE